MTQNQERVATPANEKLMLVEQAIYQCSNAGCSRLFKTKFALKRHLLVHTKDRSCVCPHCDKKFSLPQYMREHLYTHTREKPYVCGVAGCQERFRQAGKLSLHRRTHVEYHVKKYNFRLNPKAKKYARLTSEPSPPPPAPAVGPLATPTASPIPHAEVAQEGSHIDSPSNLAAIKGVLKKDSDTDVHSDFENRKQVPPSDPSALPSTLPPPSCPITHFNTESPLCATSCHETLPSVSLFFSSPVNKAPLLTSYRGTTSCKQCPVPEKVTPYLLPLAKCLPYLTLPYRPLFRPQLPLPLERPIHPGANTEHSWTA